MAIADEIECDWLTNRKFGVLARSDNFPEALPVSFEPFATHDFAMAGCCNQVHWRQHLTDADDVPPASFAGATSA